MEMLLDILLKMEFIRIIMRPTMHGKKMALFPAQDAINGQFVENSRIYEKDCEQFKMQFFFKKKRISNEKV